MNSKKKYIHAITALDHGGTENFLSRLLSYSSATHELIVLNKSKIPEINKFNHINVNIHLFNVLSPIDLFNLIRLIYKFGRNSSEFVCCYTWLYHADLICGILFKILTNIPVVWSIRSTMISKPLLGNITYIIVKINSLISFFVPTKIIYCSESSRYEHHNFGYSNKVNSIVINNGVHISEFPMPRNRIVKNSIVIGCFARWDPNKGIDNLLKIIKLNSFDRIYFNFCGSGVTSSNPEISNILENAPSQFVNCRFLGHIDNVFEYMKECHFIIIPSVSEGFPNVALESLMLGIPVISRNVGAAAEIINENGYVFETDHEMQVILTEINSNYETLFAFNSPSVIRDETYKKFSIDLAIKSYFD